MTKLHQLEQEVVMKELSEALHFGMTNALEEHAIVLRRETDVEIQSIRKANEEKQQQVSVGAVLRCFFGGVFVLCLFGLLLFWTLLLLWTLVLFWTLLLLCSPLWFGSPCLF